MVSGPPNVPFVPHVPSGGGLDFGAVYATLTWKGFATVRKVGDGSVDKNAVVEVVVKAKAAAASGTSVNVMGITGAWDDDGDGIPESSDDSFYCTGNATTNLYIK